MFTLLLSSLFISVLSNYTTNLTIEEKDKYLACTEFVHLVTTYDKDVIKETLPQKDQLFQGVTSFISLTTDIAFDVSIPSVPGFAQSID